MTLPRRSLAAAALALLLAACGSSVAPTAKPSAAAPTPGTTLAPGEDKAPDLTAMLPSTAGGVEFTKRGRTAADLAGLAVSLDRKKLDALAKGAGTGLDAVKVAEARPTDPTKSGIVLAIRVPGVDPKDIVAATFSDPKALQLVTLGGKSVYKIAASGLNVVVYVKDDVMFQVLGANSALTEAIVTALP
jgi:hypothetical protein